MRISFFHIARAALAAFCMLVAVGAATCASAQSFSDRYIFNTDRFNSQTMMDGQGQDAASGFGFRLDPSSQLSLSTALGEKSECALGRSPVDTSAVSATGSKCYHSPRFVCLDVTNQSEKAYFLPNRTFQEFSSFYFNAPLGVTIDTCALRYTPWQAATADNNGANDLAAQWLNSQPTGTPLSTAACTCLELECGAAPKTLSVKRSCEISLGTTVSVDLCNADERLPASDRALAGAQTVTCPAPTPETHPELCKCAKGPPIAHDDATSYGVPYYFFARAYLAGNLDDSYTTRYPDYLSYGMKPGRCTLSDTVPECWKRIFTEDPYLAGTLGYGYRPWPFAPWGYDVRYYGSGILGNDINAEDAQVTITKQPANETVTYLGNGRFSIEPGSMTQVRKWSQSWLQAVGTMPVHEFEYTITNDCGSSTAKVTASVYYVMTPLVLPLDGTELDLIAKKDSTVAFDLDLDGRPDPTAWLGPKSAFLVHDKNRNGRIDNRNEMFGNQGGHANGFAFLATFDKNDDKIIDHSDPIFAELRLWADLNSDGISQVAELRQLSDAGIISISVASQRIMHTVSAGMITDEATITLSDGTTKPIYDLWFEAIPSTGLDIVPR